MNKIILPVVLLVLSACGSRSGSSDEASNRFFAVEGKQITVAENSPVLQRIKIQPVETGEYSASFSVSGTVKAIPSQYAEIAAPFAGRITRSFVRLGQKISSGSPVFEISSPDFLEAGKMYFQAKQEMDLALKNLNRERDLLANKAGVAKEAEEAEVNYEVKKKDFEQTLAALKVYQIDPDKMTLGQPLIVRSPVAGEIVKDQVVIGQYFREDAGPLAIVADLNKVWVTAHVKEKDIPFIRQIQDIRIHFPALPDTIIVGKLYYTSDMLDEETRSLEVIIECNNRDHQIKPFMYGTVDFTGSPAQAIIIPDSAVLQDEDNCYVIVSESVNRFRKTNVTLVPANETHSAVLSGLKSGERIVTEGAFYFIDAR
ncbi:MAG: efflux RND transporter periplasmic adaptor subunit [Dysgonamonadaceae bacterium]|jgi:cobalt-zinc-cadmium efflux system membrane fusion protein|nr:efflux RND transporter periplasmic adaptor subunit [Dysgonamonadaceae bacterium]